MIVQAAPPPGTVHRRPRRSWAVGLAGIAALSLAACAPNNTPASYDDVAESSFMKSCSGDAPEFDGTTTTLAGADYCRCAYQVFVQNVPFDGDDQETRTADGQQVFAGYEGKTYLDYNSEMRSDPNILADDIKAKLEECRSNPDSISTTPGSAPPGTTPVEQS